MFAGDRIQPLSDIDVSGIEVGYGDLPNHHSVCQGDDCPVKHGPTTVLTFVHVAHISAVGDTVFGQPIPTPDVADYEKIRK
jgi:hypothetical protein